MKRYAIDVRCLRELPDGNWREADRSESDDEGGGWVELGPSPKQLTEDRLTAIVGEYTRERWGAR